jgi:predicted DNA-binding protein
MSRYDELAERLDALSEDLGDLSLDVLKEAMRSGAIRRPDADKKLVQARRAVEKAAQLVRNLGNPDATNEWDD